MICFDLDCQAVESVRCKFEPRLGAQLHVEQADFLSPRTTELIRQHWSSIDCVLMNPPFAGRTRSWRSVGCSVAGRWKPTGRSSRRLKAHSFFMQCRFSPITDDCWPSFQPQSFPVYDADGFDLNSPCSAVFSTYTNCHVEHFPMWKVGYICWCSNAAELARRLSCVTTNLTNHIAWSSTGGN